MSGSEKLRQYATMCDLAERWGDEKHPGDCSEVFGEAADRIDELEAALESIWIQLEPGKSEISNVPVMRVNVGALVMRALPNKPEKASAK